MMSNVKSTREDAADATAATVGAKAKKAAALNRRARRKCSIPMCPNRIVQGGVCVAHGAKRKLCAMPGCDKAVKIAGRCSAHGPARRRCDFDGCSRVAVQGGKCLSHGARRKVCKFEGGCDKNAIMEGMCKKHHDLARQCQEQKAFTIGQVANPLVVSNHTQETSTLVVSNHTQETSTSVFCQIIKSSSASSLSLSSSSTADDVSASDKHQILAPLDPPRYHHRGLSLFDEMPMVDALINSRAEDEDAASVKLAPHSLEIGGSDGVQNDAAFAADLVPFVPKLQAKLVISNNAVATRKNNMASMALLQAAAETPCSNVVFKDDEGSHSHNAASAAINALGTAMDALETAMQDYYSPTLDIFEHMQDAEGDKFICDSPGLEPSPRNKSASNSLARSVTFCSDVDFTNTHHLQGLVAQQQPRLLSEMDLQHTVPSNNSSDETDPTVEGNHDHDMMFTGSGFIRSELSIVPFPTGASNHRRFYPSTYDQPILLEDNLVHGTPCAPTHLGTSISAGSLGVAGREGQQFQDRLLPRSMGAEQNFFGSMYSP